MVIIVTDSGLKLFPKIEIFYCRGHNIMSPLLMWKKTTNGYTLHPTDNFGLYDIGENE